MEERCPNGCIDGYYIDPYTHKRKVCAFCQEKRRKEANTADIKDKLNLPPSLCGSNFSPEAIIPDYQQRVMEDISVKEVICKCEELIRDVSIGELPKESVLFNFGMKCKDNNFIAPFLKKAYGGGLSVLPVLTPLDIVKSRREYTSNTDSDTVGYDDILSKQVCLIILDAGSSYDDILAVKGVMQLRGLRNLATIIVTHVWNRGVAQLYGEGDEKLYSLATLYSIRYLKNQEFVSESPSRLSLDDFKERKNLNV